MNTTREVRKVALIVSLLVLAATYVWCDPRIMEIVRPLLVLLACLVTYTIGFSDGEWREWNRREGYLDDDD